MSGNFVLKGFWENGKLKKINLTEEQWQKGDQILEFCVQYFYVGTVKNGKAEGFGRLYDKSTSFKVCEGNFLNHAINGFGKQYVPEGGILYLGNIINNIANGKGCNYFSENGKLHF